VTGQDENVVVEIKTADQPPPGHSRVDDLCPPLQLTALELALVLTGIAKLPPGPPVIQETMRTLIDKLTAITAELTGTSVDELTREH